MAGVMDTFISGIVKSAMSEILKRTTGKSTATKRTKRKTRTTAKPSTTTSSRSRSTRKAGPTSGASGRVAKATGAAKKQVSKRRTVAARSKTRR
ncbi:hypothetical protein [Rhizobium sp. LjRoot254]|uniref:hypothetical protein n=1 Tax=Rhizobium sp. LjRoot254 TaxID=3342297 RepID=UPI003ECF0074